MNNIKTYLRLIFVSYLLAGQNTSYSSENKILLPQKTSQHDFFSAIENDDITKLKEFRRINPNINKKKYKFDRTLLHLAAIRTSPLNHKVIAYLVKKLNFSIHEKNGFGQKPIMCSKNLTNLKTFLELDNNSVLTNTPINTVCQNIVGELILTRDDDGDTLLHLAAKLNCPDMVIYLLKNGLIKRINEKNKAGKTPLFHLLLDPLPSAVETARCLIENGADVNARDGEGNTVIMQTTKVLKSFELNQNTPQEPTQQQINSLLRLIEYLLTHGADLTIENNKQKSLINHIQIRGDHSKHLIKLFITNGLNIDQTFKIHNPQSNNTLTFPFFLAPVLKIVPEQEKLAHSMVKYLIEQGANWGPFFQGKHALEHLSFTQEGSRKLFLCLLPVMIAKLTGINANLPFKKPVSPILLDALVKLLKYGKALPKKVASNSLQNICLLFIKALNQNIPSKNLKLTTPQEKMCCNIYFTMTPLDLREQVFSRLEQDTHLNSTMKTLTAGAETFDKNKLHDIQIFTT